MFILLHRTAHTGELSERNIMDREIAESEGWRRGLTHR